MPHFKEGIVIAIAIIIIVSVGGLLYVFGGSEISSIPVGTQNQTQSGDKDFTVLAEGDDAVGVTQRVNYRIKTVDELTTLWNEIYTNNGPRVPDVDFSKQEVLAIFDGSHSTDGYGVTVTGIREEEGMRIIDITYSESDTDCALQSTPTSPFVLITVSKSSLPLTTMKNEAVTGCQ